MAQIVLGSRTICALSFSWFTGFGSAGWSTRSSTPLANERDARGLGQHTQRGTKLRRSQPVHRLFDSRSFFLIQIKLVQVRAAPIGIFLVGRFSFGGNFHQAIPETLTAKQPALRSAGSVQIQKSLRICASAFKYGICALGNDKWPRRIGVRKLGERCPKFRFARIKTSPGIPVKMIDHRSGMKELPDACHILARDAQDHVEKFMEAKCLPYKRPHRNVSGFFFRVANGNRFRQRHARRIRGKRLESRYQRVDIGLKLGRENRLRIILNP